MCRKALPALLTGNTVVFKPATFTPWSAIFMAQLFEEAGFSGGVFNCVTGLGAAVGDALVGDPRVRAISFTGSTEVGKKIHERASRNLTRTQLELGGKNALIIMEDADLNAALEAAITAGFACAGQWCTSTSRILVQKKVHSPFLDMLAARCEQMVVGDPLDESTTMGPVAGPDQYKSICKAIDLSTFDTLEEALRLANDSCYALSSGIFTKDIEAARRYIAEIEAGLAHVNIHTGFKHPALPFGGWKESGFGLPENSQSGLEFFVNRKAVYIK
jgi:aldehyde dehydrogenase (NAD+)